MLLIAVPAIGGIATCQTFCYMIPRFLPASNLSRAAAELPSERSDTGLDRPTDRGIGAPVREQVAATRQRIAAVIEQSSRSESPATPSDVLELLTAGRFYAIRARFEQSGEPLPTALFRELGRVLIQEGRIGEGCAAYTAAGVTPPKRVLVEAGDALFAEHRLDLAQIAYRQAGAVRRLDRVADELMRSGRFFAARSVYERAGLPVPQSKFIRAARARRNDGDIEGASAAWAAAGFDAPA